MIIESIVTGPFQENTWILGDSNTHHALIIDPGDNALTIVKKLEALHLIPVFIINTHAHPDHIGAAAELQRRFDLPFAIHTADVITYNSAIPTAQFLGVMNLELPQITNYLHDGQVLEINSHHVQVLHTPGHTPGSVSFLTGKHLFSGDTLFKESVGRTDLPNGSYKSLQKSLVRLKQLPADIQVHPGHGESTTIAAEIQNNPFLKDLS
ncbi:MAG TPA: MBL fold metallo-hydrolase [Candidatus Marinimicrobia bacterium]|nr:MBL fold metallo-hydrolase [Candidatus Neomarinimicrobiota bacterium]